MRRASTLLLILLLTACSAPPPKIVRDGNAERGRELIVSYDCVDCHEIPGVPAKAGAIQRISLDGVARRDRISRDSIENTPENMVRYILRPKELNPLSTMPGLSGREKDARDVAAYLMTLD